MINNDNGRSPNRKKSSRASRGRKPNGDPNPVDVHVGRRMRLRRELLKLSQEQLGKMIGLTFQQIQKYERGQNRIGASRLWDLSRVLDVPIGFFYEDMDNKTAEQSPMMFTSENVPGIDLPESDPMTRRETLELVRAFYKINNRAAAKSLLEVIIHMSKSN